MQWTILSNNLFSYMISTSIFVSRKQKHSDWNMNEDFQILWFENYKLK